MYALLTLFFMFHGTSSNYEIHKYFLKIINNNGGGHKFSEFACLLSYKKLNHLAVNYGLYSRQRNVLFLEPKVHYCTFL